MIPISTKWKKVGESESKMYPRKNTRTDSSTRLQTAVSTVGSSGIVARLSLEETPRPRFRIFLYLGHVQSLSRGIFRNP